VNADDYLNVESSVLAALRNASVEWPDHEFIRIRGQSFSYADVLTTTENVARGLLELGLASGDRVGVMAGNLPESLWTWLGANAAGLIDVPFNAEARGRLLAYFVEDTEPRVLVGTAEYLATLADTVATDPEVVICIGECEVPPFGDRTRQLDFDELLDIGTRSTVAVKNPRPGDTATIMFTSGTTGPSKGVMLPQRYYPAQGSLFAWAAGLREDDVFYCAQPLFHIDARVYTMGVLSSGGAVVHAERFSVSRFWDEVREHKATLFGFIGTMMWLLYKQPSKPDDAEQPARLAMCSSVPHDVQEEFSERFGVQINEGYGMTESAIITSNDPEHLVARSVGGPAPHLDVAILDDADSAVEAGELGEICFRPKASFTTMQGYWGKSAESVEAWRNLWFHTGDLGRLHASGQLEYVGRKKDSIRRRGENVSAWEVEQVISAHPGVLEVAAIGVPSEVGEEDVAVLIVPASDQALDPAELVRFVEADLPRFAVPRYVELVDELPKTPSERVAKGKVRERGITAAAWDANVALGRHK